MIVITTLLTKNFISVGSDSMITRVNDGIREITKVNEPKFVFFQKLNCVAIYWGLAQVFVEDKPIWTTIGWLKGWVKEQDKYEDIESFVKALTKELENKIEFGVGTKANAKDRGIGIHIAGFERIGENLIQNLLGFKFYRSFL